MTLQELEQLAQSLRATTISHIALSGKDWSVRMTTAPQPPLRPPPEEAPSFTAVCSPAPGVALLHHPLVGQNFVTPGQQIKAGDVVALVKVGVIYLPVHSPVSGTVISTYVNHGETVEFEKKIANIQRDTPAKSGL